MADESPETGDDLGPGESAGPASERGANGETPRTARWQKVVGVIGVIVFVLLILLLVTGDHGPGRHAFPAVTAMTAPEVISVT